jgi:hypothetical protein
VRADHGGTNVKRIPVLVCASQDTKKEDDDKREKDREKRDKKNRMLLTGDPALLDLDELLDDLEDLIFVKVGKGNAQARPETKKKKKVWIGTREIL